MRPEQRRLIHDAVLKARSLLEEEIAGLLEGTYGLHADGTLEEASSLPLIGEDTEAGLTRKALEDNLSEQEEAGQTKEEAVSYLIKETAFTHLNRLVAIKMLEARNLIRGTVNKGLESNQFKHWLAQDEEGMRIYQSGERDRAFRLFLSSLYRELSREIKVLFDPDTLPSRLFPRPAPFSELLSILNDPELEAAWTEDEAIGWVYQYFSEEEKKEVFDRLYKKKQKVEKRDIPAATQLFTPRWIVEYLVQNTLGRLWLNMQPDSELKDNLPYLVPMQGEQPAEPLRQVKEITLLDPACGTMHFGLVAFDLFYRMYTEEMEKAGQNGWPETPSVSKEEDIPSAIIAHNLFGADIDLRAVQLSALTLYLKAKTKNPEADITSSNLACAEVLPIDGEKLNQFIDKTPFSHPVIPKLLRELWPCLKQTSYLGSLARIERDISSLIQAEREKAEEEFRGPRLFREEGELALPTEEEAWRSIEEEIISALDAFALSLSPEAYFAREAEKGIRLLDILRRRYDVVATNPPYMGKGNMNLEVSKILDQEYPVTKSDLYTAFMERCIELSCSRIGMITQQTFMFISSFNKLRDQVIDNLVIENMAHTGPRAFEEISGEKVNTTVYVLRKESNAKRRDSSIGTYFRLVKAPAKQAAFERSLATSEDMYHLRQSKIRIIPGHPWVYWIPDSIRSLFQEMPLLGTIAIPKNGTTTGNNSRFLRHWWEAGKKSTYQNCDNRGEALKSNIKWFPCMKAGNYCRWFGNREWIINWLHDGREIHSYEGSYIRNPNENFKEGISYPLIAGRGISSIILDKGFIFNVAVYCIYPPQEYRVLMLAILNSKLADYVVGFLNPTINYVAEDVKRLPLIDIKMIDRRVLTPVNSLVLRSRLNATEDDTTYDFVAPLLWEDGLEIKKEREEEIARLEAELDDLVYDLYGISAEDRELIEKELAERAETVEEGEGEEGSPPKEEEETKEYPLTREELAFRWVSYAVGIVLGRFSPGTEGELGSAITEDEKGEKKHLFSQEIEEKLRFLTDPDGICVLDPGHSDDLPARVEEALSLMLGEEGAKEVTDTLGGDLRKYLSRTFFSEHAKLYRRRPCYWYLATEKKNYGFFLFCERVDADTLFKIKTNYLQAKLNLLKHRIGELREKEASQEGREKRATAKEMEQAEALLAETEDFQKKLQAVIDSGYDPHPDDGVLINLSLLRELVPWPKKGELEKTWKELSSGSYDWSHMAMRHWPERVKEKCQKDKSLRIAHGME